MSHNLIPGYDTLAVLDDEYKLRSMSPNQTSFKYEGKLKTHLLRKGVPELLWYSTGIGTPHTLWREMHQYGRRSSCATNPPPLFALPPCSGKILTVFRASCNFTITNHFKSNCMLITHDLNKSGKVYSNLQYMYFSNTFHGFGFSVTFPPTITPNNQELTV